MNVQKFVDILDTDFYTGVPDSQLKPLCDYLMDIYSISNKHIIAANEGNATALAAGYYLSTGKTAAVYLQNSGVGNIINPVASLLNDLVYGIPCIFIVGWRGEPGIHDEPQHIYQGKVTLELLHTMDISTFVITTATTEIELINQMKMFRLLLNNGKSVAFVVKKGAFVYSGNIDYKNDNHMEREEIIRHITEKSQEDIVISTTGKASRELFEIREANNQSHQYDFLTVGSMGHSSSIAMAIALNTPSKKVWCIDGDGAVLMHMGALAVIGTSKPNNLIHIVINNGAHETVGGMPTVMSKIELTVIAKACGYPVVYLASNDEELDIALKNAKESNQLCFIEVKSTISSRSNLGRPTTTTQENKVDFMNYILSES